VIKTRSYQHATEQQLMSLVQADDAEAFGALYDRLAHRALSIAHTMRVDPGRVEDVVQDAFVSVWRGRAAYRVDRGRVHSWILGIVHNRAVDDLRRDSRRDRSRVARDDLIEQLPGPDDVERDAVERDEVQELRGLLARLPIAQREVIALAYFGRLTHVEIATQLALPLGTVKGRMRLGLDKLRFQIDPDEEGSIDQPPNRDPGLPVAVAVARK
jgi:RNA polymerase sigma-70 factor, ECF subfamily